MSTFRSLAPELAMPIRFTCSCSKKLQVRDELAGKNVRCPGCGMTLRVPAPRETDAAPGPPARPRAFGGCPLQTPRFPGPGHWHRLGCHCGGPSDDCGGIFIMAVVLIGDGDFKPAGLIVFGFPGLLWIVFGSLLLRLRQRFVTPFWAFLMVNLFIGVFFATQGGRCGRGDARSFAAIGLGFIFGSLLFQLFQSLLDAELSPAGRGGKPEAK